MESLGRADLSLVARFDQELADILRVKEKLPFQNCRVFFGHGCTTKFWKEHYTTLANITFPHSEKNQENICYWYNKCKNHEPLGHHLLLARLISYRTLFQNVMFNDWTFVNPCNKLSTNINGSQNKYHNFHFDSKYFLKFLFLIFEYFDKISTKIQSILL